MLGTCPPIISPKVTHSRPMNRERVRYRHSRQRLRKGWYSVSINLSKPTEIRFWNFEIPIQSKISFKSIDHVKLRDIQGYRKVFSNSSLKKDILYKKHLDKAFYKKVLLPFSILVLVIYFDIFKRFNPWRSYSSRCNRSFYL